MAGETTKTTALTNTRGGLKRFARNDGASVKRGRDKHQFTAATALEAGDNLIMNIKVPSNAVIDGVYLRAGDLDTGACPTLVLDVGVAAAEAFKDVTSGTVTAHAQDDIIDADLLIDGSTQGRAALDVWTRMTPQDPTTHGPDDVNSMLWELLGYDKDPQTQFNVVVQSQAASSALGASAYIAIMVEFSVD